MAGWLKCTKIFGKVSYLAKVCSFLCFGVCTLQDFQIHVTFFLQI